MSEQSKIDAERAAFEAWYLREIADGQDSLTKYPNGHYVNDTTMDAWHAWQARASLPVGVPSIRDFADEVKQLCKDFSDMQNRPYMGDVTAAIDGLYEQFMQSDAMPAAPTVKAEQVQCEECGGNGTGGNHEDDCSKAPSPPAAGSAVEEVEVVAWVTPEKDRAITALTEAAAREDGGAMLSSVRPYSVPCITVAQQSAPERVSVDRALMQRFAHGHNSFEDIRLLQEFLASHGRGEA